MEKSKNLGVLWITIWFFLNVGLTLLNKGLMHFWSFKFPVMMSFIHQAISTFLSLIEAMFFRKNNNKELKVPVEKYEKTVMGRIIALSFLFTMNIVIGNVSLRYCTVAFTQVARAIIPMLTLFFSVVFLGSHFTKKQVFACTFICVGVAMSCFGEIGLTTKGLVYTILGCILSSAKSISIKKTLSGDYTLESADLLTRIAPFSAIEMFTLSAIKGEPNRIIEPENPYKASWACIASAIVSGIMAYFLNLTNFLATHYTSPLTVTIVGCVKQITTIILSVIIFNKPLTKLNFVGIIVTTIGSTWYSLLKLEKPVSKVTEEEKNLEEVDVESVDNEAPLTQGNKFNMVTEEEEEIQDNNSLLKI